MPVSARALVSFKGLAGESTDGYIKRGEVFDVATQARYDFLVGKGLVQDPSIPWVDVVPVSPVPTPLEDLIARNAAAMAQARIDNILNNAEQPSEVVDLRMGADGTVYPTAKARVDAEIENVNDEISSMKPNFNMSESEEVAPLASELIDGTGWTSTGWTGDYATGFVHTVGQTTPLSKAVSVAAGKLYQVVVTVTDNDVNSGFKFTVSIGGSAPFQIYKGGGVGTDVYEVGIKAIDTNGLVITPTSDFTGTIKSVSVKEIIGTIEPTFQIKNALGTNVLEMRPTKESLLNVFLGKNSGKNNTTGYQNTIIGQDAMANNTSGFWNSALGHLALHNNTVGSRNVAIGYNSLLDNISGHRNYAIGTFSLRRNTHGAYNIGLGADSLFYNSTGNYNIAIGTVSLDHNTTGSFNVGIGYNALSENVDTSYNVAVGHWALRKSMAHNNTAVGSMAMAEATGSGATALGYQALHKSTGINNTAIGQQAALALLGGNANTVIGRTALLSLTSGSDNTVIGQDGIRNLVTGSYNTVIGQGSGLTLTSGNNNIIIGENCDVPAADTSDHLNIGKLIYGDLSSKRVGIGLAAPLAKLHIGAGTATVPAVRINSGTILDTPMNGALEYDGTNLYFTIGTTRKAVAFVS